MSAEASIAAGRAAAEALMVDTYEAFTTAWEKVDGLEVETDSSKGVTPAKSGGRYRGADTDTRYVTIGGVERPVVEGGLHIPLSSPAPEPGWVYVCTAVGPHSDPALLGRRWRVVDVSMKSFATKRALNVVEVT